MSAFDLTRLVRDNIRRLQPYSSARDEFTGQADVYLDANENPYPNGLNRYPDPLAGAVLAELAAPRGLAPGQVCLGNGSDEIIDLVYRIFCEPRLDNVIILPPTYGMYRVCAELHDVQVQEVPLDAGFQPDPDAILAAANTHTKVLWLCSPNNPSGNDLQPALVEKLAHQFPGIVVIDEAYLDFANRPSYTRLLPTCPNLIVLQTFSKAWGLAGIRLGMALASAELIAYFRKVKPPYNINQLSQQAALEALRQPAQTQQQTATILAQREALHQFLLGLPEVERVFPSAANFLLVQVRHPRELYQYLLARGIIVRDRSRQPGCQGCLRITVGTPAENAQLQAALAAFQPGL